MRRQHETEAEAEAEASLDDGRAEAVDQAVLKSPSHLANEQERTSVLSGSARAISDCPARPVPVGLTAPLLNPVQDVVFKMRADDGGLD